MARKGFNRLAHQVTRIVTPPKAHRTPTEIGQTVPRSPKQQRAKTAALRATSRGKSVSTVYGPSPTVSASRSRAAARAQTQKRKAQREVKQAQRQIRKIIRKQPAKAERRIEKRVNRKLPERKPVDIEIGGPKERPDTKRTTVIPRATARQILAPERDLRREATRSFTRELTRTPKPPKRVSLPKQPQAKAEVTPRKTGEKPKINKLRRKRGKKLKSTLRAPLPGLDAEQQKVMQTVLNTGAKKGATRKELLAAAETAIVESGSRNLNYGDADSLGWRQERTSIYGTGPKGPTNVRASAKRYFNESAQAGRGMGRTAGQLAQAVQGSAFPERYDQVRSQAKPIVRAFVKKTKAAEKVKKGHYQKSTEKAAKKFAKGAPAPAPKKKPGAYEGSKKAVLEKLPKGIRAEGRHDKRTPSENASVGGASDSDHLTTNKGSYAADIPPNPKVYARLRRELGLKPASTGEDTVVKDGYRYQLIFGSQYGHGDHIHLGAEWVGAGAAPSVSSAGGYGSVGSVTAAMGSTGTAVPVSRRKAKRKARARKLEGREKARFIRSLIAGTTAPPTSRGYARGTSSLEDYIASLNVDLGL